jgi:hypothetical protein
MCEPTLIMLAAAGVSAGASVAGGYAQKSAYEAQAENERLAGRQALQAANVESQQIRSQGQRELGAARATQAGRGLDVTSGTSADVAGEIAINNEHMALMKMYEGRLGAWQKDYSAKVLKSQGKSAVVGGYLKATQTLLGAAAKVPSGYFNSTPQVGGTDPITGR